MGDFLDSVANTKDRDTVAVDEVPDLRFNVGRFRIVDRSWSSRENDTDDVVGRESLHINQAGI
jgi:hypothetical protein